MKNSQMPSIYVITGTSSGLGKGLAEHYIKKNKVYGIARSFSDIKNPNYTHLTGSVSDERFIVSCLSQILKEHKKIDVLINNAGIASMNHLLSTPLESVKQIFDTNFNGAFLCTREFSKALKNAKNPRIINISSIASSIEIEGELAYSASKSALDKMSKLSAVELAAFNITVNTIALPPFESKLTNAVEEHKLKAINKRRIINGRINTEHVVHAIDFLCDPKSYLISGEVLSLGGVK